MAEFKYLIFFAALVLGVPLGVLLASRSPLLEKAVVLLIVASTVLPDATSINFMSREFYFALTKGFEISLGDLGALVLIGVMLRQRAHYAAAGWPPMTVLFLLVLVSGFASWATAPSGIVVPAAAQAHPFFLPYDVFETGAYPLFELSKWVRGFLLFLVIAFYLRKPGNLDTLILAVCLCTIWLGLSVLADRYVYHIHRVKGTLPHPNSLATYMAMCGTFLFSILLAEQRPVRVALLGAGVALSGLSVVMTISRGGLAALVVGLFLALALLGWRNLTVKNGVIVLAGVIAGLVVLAAAADTLLERFVGEQDAADDLAYRMYYNDQALLMARDRIFGVGLGNFSAFSWDRYAELVDPDNPPGTPAHNIWFLTLGEAGYPGLVVFAAFWIRFFALAAPLALWRLRGMECAAATGAMLLCLVCHVQAMVQLSFRQTPIFFMLMIAVAIVSTLARGRPAVATAAAAPAARQPLAA